MESVGVRELKNRLSYYLHAVRRGESLIVTARGEPVARLVPIAPPSTTCLPPEMEERMWELAAEGVLDWSGGQFQVPESIAVNRGTELFSDLVVEDRE